MEIGILTYQNQLNYGGVLQAYALQEILREQHIEASVINYWCVPQNTDLRPTRLLSLVPFWRARCRRAWWLRLAYPRRIIACNRRRLRTCRFLDEYIRQSERAYPDAESLSLLSGYETVVVGSDQVWNHKSGNLRACLLETVPPNIRRLSYAASLGVQSLPDRVIPQFREALARFSQVSVREPSSVAVLRPLLPDLVPIHWCLDPTLVVARQTWKNMTDMEHVPISPHAVVYWLGDVDALDRAVRGAFGLGFERVRVYFSWYRFALRATRDELAFLEGTLSLPGVEPCLDAGPREFVSAVAGASAVISDSFHAMMFATVFEKRMQIIIRSAGNRIDSANRIVDFASRYGLMNAVSDEVRETGMALPPIPFPDVWRLLDEDCRRSRQALLDGIGVR